MTRRLIGIGNPDRGDDAAGWMVAGAVSSWEVERRAAGSFDLVDLWDESDDVVIVDAMRSGAAAGEVVRFDAKTHPLPLGAFRSTHAFGPAAASGLARTLDRRPRALMVYGIEVGHTAHGEDMSPEVSAAVRTVVEELQNA